MTTISTIENDPVRGPPVLAGAALLRTEPDRNCPLCPRLAGFREATRIREPEWFNSPVPSFGDPAAALLIVGLAPGRQDANRTGRPFTGDYAGDLLYATLLEYGFAKALSGTPGDGLTLVDCRISSAVHCVRRKNFNRPNRRCFTSRRSSIQPARSGARRVAHGSTLGALGLRAAAAPFAHGACISRRDGL
jgi:hypothetical protein